MKSVFEYDNYREFLKDSYLEMKSRNKKFSFRYFARQAGFKACNVLKLVMDGKRNISPHSIEKFAKGLKLTKTETLFFKYLVLFNQSTNSEERGALAEELIKQKSFKKIYPMKESQFNFYRYWYFTPIREMIGLPDFKEDPEWIAKRLTPPITPEEAKRALDELTKLGLIARDATGSLRQTEMHLKTDDEVTSSSIATFHRQMLGLASESIDLVSRDKRDISAQTFTVSQATARKIKEKVQSFRKEIIDMVVHDAEDPDAVYQLNLQLFPLVEARPQKVDE
jgi:uncharacterized protein (TIGR02147 family)